MTDDGLPPLALSVRQPWAWAILHGGKQLENRSRIAVSRGGMKPGPLCIHASKGMTRDEYESARDFMRGIGVACPLPDELVRGGVIGAVRCDGVVKASDSPWFFGPVALVLVEPAPLAAPIPVRGELGYFEWRKNADAAALDAPKPWMMAWPGKAEPRSQKRKSAAPAAGGLFPEAT